jgi:hypothetical protein
VLKPFYRLIQSLPHVKFNGYMLKLAKILAAQSDLVVTVVKTVTVVVSI